MFATTAVVLTLASTARLSAAYEGYDFMNELANEVRDRVDPDAVLPNNCKMDANTPADRDLGQYPYCNIDPDLDVEVTEGSLQTEAELNGGAPEIAIVRIVRKSGGGCTEPPPAHRMGSAGGQSVRRLNGLVNPTAETTIYGWRKNNYDKLKEWMDAQQNSDRLMIVHSSCEVLFAGCNESTILAKYNEVISAGGGTQKVVVAGEVSPFHYDAGWWYASNFPNGNTDTLRHDFLLNMRNSGCAGCTENWATTQASCTTGYCASPPKYQFANPGFIMGKIGDVDQMLQNMKSLDYSMDRTVSDYFLNHPTEVAIDYAGVLVMSLHNMLIPAARTTPVTVDAPNSQKRLLNVVTGTNVCFVHGDGNSYSSLQGYAGDLL